MLLANRRRHPRRLASAFLLPEIAEAVLEPREDHWMITNRLNKPPRVCGGIRPLVVCEYQFGMLIHLAVPLALWEQNPVERFT